MTAAVLIGDCIETMRRLPADSISAIVTDPPYGMSEHKPDEVRACLAAWLAGEEYRPKGKKGFMGRSWDAWVPGPEVWAEALRVAKPGAHLVAFAAPRTVALMEMAIRLGGWEIRDQLQYLFGTGFPKAHNLRDERGEKTGQGTALKPAQEPIILARKPLVGTVAANVLKHGTGALNIDGCRIPASANDVRAAAVPMPAGTGGVVSYGGGTGRNGERFDMSAGRWPANLILDEEAAALLDAEAGMKTSGKVTKTYEPTEETSVAMGKKRRNLSPDSVYSDSGGPSRFFYTAKASRSEREAGLADCVARHVNDGRETSIDNPYQRGDTKRLNVHPTVKPIALMRWLVRLITPPGGIVLDPFTGSGSTGAAAVLEGAEFLGCEVSEEYAEIARARIAHWQTVDPERAPR